MATTPPQRQGEADVMVVVNHLIEQMYDVIEALNTDIDRLAAERDRVKAAVLALTPGAPVAPMPIKPTAGERALASPPPKPKAKKAKASRPGQPKYDYERVARVARAAIAAGQAAGKKVAAEFAVSDAMGQWLIGEARKQGHDIPRTRAARGSAITPSQIRHEVEPIPDQQKLTVNDPIEHIADSTNMHSLGFATRPTHVEHPPIETERNGWHVGKAAEVLGV